jgi:hypothetical protein
MHNIINFQEGLKAFVELTINPNTWILGIRIERDRGKGTLQLCQDQYVDDLLRKLGLQDIKPASTPQIHGEHLEAPQDTDIKLSADEQFIY